MFSHQHVESFTEWYDWTNRVEERVDTFMTQERQDHERIIAGLLAEERKQIGNSSTNSTSSTTTSVSSSPSITTSTSTTSTSTATTSLAHDSKRLSAPAQESFVNLCDSLVQSEKDYADDLDTLLQEYWIPLCTQGVLQPATEIPKLFGNVEKVYKNKRTNNNNVYLIIFCKIALAHVEVLAKLEAEQTDVAVLSKYGVFVAEAKLVLEHLVKDASSPDSIASLYTAFTNDATERTKYYASLVESRPVC